ncbi:hypothetical protein Asppvi_010213 [Aspergillus pseudoviridinutans]|uniref:FAD-binding domain-containing protein n=1 Tax=Aspergillus pseudoviridinutans TaxID=1517512 RepID=A0A9P3BMU4_9EURO|nr:uncharacterized protein Asppvi_010213 [Aspergillus pseudoviridinutans]GIJ91248.1 hypothetical protein Asppvi_010213 [Aspergillus pseudoviridinutans]
MQSSSNKPLNVAIIGAGLGGLSAAIALRRQGHQVTVYERYDFAGEVGASLGVTPNCIKLLEQWGVDIPAAKPVSIMHMKHFTSNGLLTAVNKVDYSKFIVHNWETGEIKITADWSDYKSRFGRAYKCFHRIDLHRQLQISAFEKAGEGPACILKVNHKAVEMDPEAGIIKFENAETVTADLIVAADGIRSQSRISMGIAPKFQMSSSCCYRSIVRANTVRSLGLYEFLDNYALEYWGGHGINKIVMSPCSDGETLGFYCFYPTTHNDLREDGWNISATPEQLTDTFPTLDPRVKTLMLHAEDIKMWRLYVHEPYPYWAKGKACLLGDAEQLIQ